MRKLLCVLMLLGFILAGGASVSADQLTMQEGANISLSATAGPNSTLTISSTDTDENVKVSADDTTAGFLNGKLVGGAGITLTEGNGGTNETLTIAAPETLTTKGDVLIHNGTSEARLAVGASGQFLTSDTSGNLLWANPAEGDQLFNSNILLNAYRTGENLDLTVSKMIDGAVDAFTDASGVDATASTNEAFSSSNDYYEPTRTGTTTIPAVEFDGTGDYLNRGSDLTGNADSKVGTLSLWLTPTSSGSTESWIFSAGTTYERFYVRHVNNAIVISGHSSGSVNNLYLHSGNGELPAGKLVHVLASWDLANSKAHLYINGVDKTGTPTKINSNIDYTISDWVVGGRALGGGSFYTTHYAKGDVGQLWFSTSEYFDITNATNRAKFIDDLGNPVDLGSNGSTPTGNQPIVYLNNTLSTWQNNLGSGGNFSVNGGGLTAGTDLSTSGTADNLILVSNSQTAKTEPNGANILLMAEDLAADIVINTDLKASVSRDGGTTFTQVTLSDAGEFEKGNLLTGTVDISGQPTGTDMEWKVETLNNKFLNLHGVGLEWR